MKIYISYLVVFLLLLSDSYATFAQYTKWEKDVSFTGIEFKKIRYREDGRESLYANGILKQKTVIEGYPCYKKVFLSKEGRLKIFILAEDFEVAGNPFEKNTQVYIRDNSYIIHCLYKPIVQGYHCKGTNYKQLLFLGSTNFQLYPSGKLKFFQPVNDIEIQGVWCRPSAVRGGVELYESGKLKECTSAKDQIIQGEKVEKKFTLRFDEKGYLIFNKKMVIFGDKRWHD